MSMNTLAVVPYYFLVWYNNTCIYVPDNAAVVPYYFLVWYNILVDVFPN